MLLIPLGKYHLELFPLFLRNCLPPTDLSINKKRLGRARQAGAVTVMLLKLLRDPSPGPAPLPDPSRVGVPRRAPLDQGLPSTVRIQLSPAALPSEVGQAPGWSWNRLSLNRTFFPKIQPRFSRRPHPQAFLSVITTPGFRFPLQTINGTGISTGTLTVLSVHH